MNIVTVTEDGGLTARAPGQATVTAQIDGLQAEVLVTVYAAALEAKMYQARSRRKCGQLGDI